MLRHLPFVIGGLALAGLGWRVLDQDRHVAALRSEVAALRAAVAETEHRSAAAQPASPAPVRIERPASAAMPTAPPAVMPAPAQEQGRTAVSVDEVARVESAVLTLLESDRPELREKLRAVVQEQQEAIEQQEQEQRRERWIARTEARLARLSGEAALSAEQRQTIVQLMLASRDQIADVRRSANTGEAYVAARATAKRIRKETDAAIRELLSPAQYEAYRRARGDDDDDDERAPAPQR